jgi:hypothetical protein
MPPPPRTLWQLLAKLRVKKAAEIKLAIRPVALTEAEADELGNFPYFARSNDQIVVSGEEKVILEQARAVVVHSTDPP